jgi:succinoglycan biosynthesis protein ExoA
MADRDAVGDAARGMARSGPEGTPRAWPERPRVTVFVPTYNEAAAIEGCLRAILAQDYPAELTEILVVDGQSTDATRARVEALMAELPTQAGTARPNLRLLGNPDRDLAAAWNIAAREATGDAIGLVVAHSFIEPDYLSAAVRHLAEGSADVVGGPYRMVGETPASRAVAAAMSSPFGVGGSVYRYKGDVPSLESVGNAIYPLALLRRFLPFDRAIGKGEDWELHYRMRQQGVRFAQFADIRYEFHARGTLGQLWRQQAGYARAKVNIIRRHSRDAVRWTHFVPAVFVLWVLLGGVAAGLLPAWRTPWLGGLGLYVVADLVASVRAAARHGWGLLPRLPVTFLCMHLSYGLGMLGGLLGAVMPSASGAPRTTREDHT